ncbi:MAG: hypothetical protein KBT39_09670 [Bacteroidales bacterium]|nr:hypothetical protein [Bacteroidales bacterium]
MKLKHLLTVALIAICGGSAIAQNLLQNSDFSVVGALASGAKDRYAVGTPWVSNVAFANMGIRVMASSAAKEGGNVLVWRGSGNSNYISQPVAAEAGAAYEVTISQVASGNANANFNVGIGTAAGKYDVASGVVRLGTSNDGVKTVKILMPTTVDATNLYFTFANTPTNSASSGSDPVSQIDYIKMVAIDALAYAKEVALGDLPSAGDPIFGISEEKIQAAKEAINAATTRAEVEAATSSLTIPALSGNWAILNATNGLYLGDAVLSAESQTATFEKANSGFYIKINDKYINMRGDNNWSMSADATAKTAWTFTLVDDKYTIKGPKGLIGTDAKTAGAAVYGDKKEANNGYWKIVDLEAAALASAKGQLQEIINDIKVPTANIEGSSSNIITWDGASVEVVKTAVEDAQDVVDNSTSLSEVNAQIEALKNFDTDIEVINNIDKDTPYNVIMAKEGLGWTNKAVTFTYSEGNQNNYAMAYSDEPGETNYNQSVYFDKNGNDELYMYIIDAAGKKWYVTDGTHVGSTVAWAGSQIRMTDVEEDAMPLDIYPSFDKKGVCEIVNIWTGEHIGSTNNNGFYCSNDNYDLAIKPAAQKRINIAIKKENKYGTIILPANVENHFLGIKFYTVSAGEGSSLELDEVTDLKANTPYIVENQSKIDDASAFIDCYAKGFKAQYTNGLLTGTLEPIAKVEAGKYLLQNQGGKVGFYKVPEEGTLKLGANRCYLTKPVASEAKEAFFFDEETAIKALDALTSGKAEIFDMNGRKLNKMQKGINIVNGVKVLVK